MRFKVLIMMLLVSLFVVGITSAQDAELTHFIVRIENVSGGGMADLTGIFNTPVGADSPGPAVPGGSFVFNVTAEPGQALSFATMFGQSNDLFYGPGQAGIVLYDMGGTPISGDVTDQIQLWDAGTEVNEEPGVGVHQAPRQMGPNDGEDEHGVVQVVNDMYSYPAVADSIRVTVTPQDGGQFEIRIDNISGDTSAPTPFSPGVWVLHSPDHPALFLEGYPDWGLGLENLAEDANPTMLATVLAGSDFTTPLAPGVFAVHTSEYTPFFDAGMPDRQEGLEALAEDGNPAPLLESLAMHNFPASGVFNTPLGADAPGPLLPGNVYEFSFDAAPGYYLSFATMFVQSNDLFYTPDAMGFELFHMDGTPISGDVTRYISLWDAGTEVNEEPGVGVHQAPRQMGPNDGDDEIGVVQVVNDMYSYPIPAAVLRVTISSGDDMMMGGM